MKNPIVKPAEAIVEGYDYRLLDRIKFQKPQQVHTIPFEEVMNNRRSVREFNPVSMEQLSEVLWYAAKVKTLQSQENGYILTHRGTPSAGARHPIDIFIYEPKLFGKEYFYYYNPFDHSVNLLENSDKLTSELIPHLDEIVSIKQGMVLWFVAHLERSSAKYNQAESLVWRDAGALINGIQLTCTAMGMNSCPVGSLGEPYVSEFFAAPDVFGVGGIIIG